MPPKCPIESQPSIGHRRSSGACGVICFLVGLLALFFAFLLKFFDFPFVAGARFTGDLDSDRLLSASDSVSDALPGLKMAVKCFDLRVLDERVSFRTTFCAGLFSMSDSEFPLSFDSDFDVELGCFGGIFLFIFIDFRVVAGDESALDSVSESLVDDVSVWLLVADESAELFDVVFSAMAFGRIGGRPFGLIGGFDLPPTLFIVFDDCLPSSSSDSVEFSGEKMLFFFESFAAKTAVADFNGIVADTPVDGFGGGGFVVAEASAGVGGGTTAVGLFANDLTMPCNCCCCCLTMAGGALPPVGGCGGMFAVVVVLAGGCFGGAAVADEGAGGGFFLASACVGCFFGFSGGLSSSLE